MKNRVATQSAANRNRAGSQGAGEIRTATPGGGFKPSRRLWPNLVLLGALAPTLSGCMFLELNGGYYPITSYDAPSGAPAGGPELSSKFGFGISLGTYIEFSQTVRIAAGGEFGRVLIEDSDGGEGHINRAAPGARTDVSVMDVGDDTKVRATAEALFGSSTLVYTPKDGSEQSFEDGKNFSLFIGATYAWFENDTDTLMASVGPHYIKSSNDEGGSVSSTGIGIKLTISANLFAGGGGSGSDTPSEGGEGIVAITMTLANESSIIGDFANAARSHGCSVDEKSNQVIARCSEGNIVYLQNGKKAIALCQKGMSEGECNQLHQKLKSYTPY